MGTEIPHDDRFDGPQNACMDIRDCAAEVEVASGISVDLTACYCFETFHCVSSQRLHVSSSRGCGWWPWVKVNGWIDVM